MMFAKPSYIADDTLKAQYVPSGPDWLVARQQAALASFRGYPAQQVEEWKYTNVKPVLTLSGDARPNQGDVAKAAAALDALPAGPRIVFVNGHYHTALSDIPSIAGLSVEPLSKGSDGLQGLLGVLSAEDTTNGFNAASLVRAQDGFVIRATGVIDQPVVIAHIYTGGAQAERLHSRHAIVLEPNARLDVVEIAIGVPDAEYLAIAACEIFLAEHSFLTHTLIQRNSAKGAEILTRYVRQDKESEYHGITFTTGAKVNRVETQVLVRGEKAHAAQYTVQLLREERHSDSTTRVVHDTVEATSNQHCRMILDGHARGVFQGKTVVARDAQKTDARQLNKNLLLSRTAWVNTKPELEIYADDVKCSHGATTGELDSQALFYLQTRGIDKPTAKRLLVEAFADQVIDETPVSAELKDYLRDCVAEWMRHG